MLNVRSSGPSSRGGGPRRPPARWGGPPRPPPRRPPQRARADLRGAEQRTDLVRLASQPDDQDAREVRVARVARERATQELHAVAVRVHAAARAMGQRDDAVDVRVPGERAARHLVGDRARDRRRAVDRRQHTEVIARRDLPRVVPVAPDDPLERRRTVDVLRRPRVRAERVVAVERAHREIVQVHVLAGRDVARREPDDLVVALHRLAPADRARRDLVRRGHEPRDSDVLVDQAGAADQLRAGDDDVVVGMEADRERGSREHGVVLKRRSSHVRRRAARSRRNPIRCRARARPAAPRSRRAASCATT